MNERAVVTAFRNLVSAMREANRLHAILRNERFGKGGAGACQREHANAVEKLDAAWWALRELAERAAIEPNT